jgi:predicted dehydrogenase
MMSQQPKSRRDFLRESALVTAAMAAPTIISSSALGNDQVAAPSNRVSLGVIGYGPRCRYDLASMIELPDVQCVAIADVQATRRDEGKAFVDKHYGTQDCQTYRDFREMFDRKDLDAVLIATGDRWHAPASIMAAEAGLDVYSEKPCGMTVALCQQLADTFDRTGRVFQAGTQRRSVTNFQQAVELAHSGKLGKVHTLHASVYRPVLDNSWLPAEPTPNREKVDWNLWLGTAPWRPFNATYVNGGWRGVWDFDSGAKLLDWGAHTVDLCQWANRSDATTPVEYRPEKDRIVCRYADGVQLILYFLDTPFGERPGWVQELGTCPVRFEGDEGSVEVGDSGGIVIKPQRLADQMPPLPKKVRGLDVTEHARDFINSIKTRKPTRANQQVMRRSHISCFAASIAWTLGRELRLDPDRELFIGDDEANLLLSRPARDPFAEIG